MNEVEAVKSKDDIMTISSLLEKHAGEIYRDIWSLGINTALRISDLLSIKMEDLTSETLTLKESKTGKTRRITLNRRAQEIVTRRKQAYPSDVYLFSSKGQQSSRQQAYRPLYSRQKV